MIRTIIVFLFTCLLCFQCFSQNTYKDKRGKDHLIGIVDFSAFDQDAFTDWDKKYYDRYNISESALERFKGVYNEQIMLEVYFGTWCGDSKRELGHLFKILDESGVSRKNIKLIALDNRSGKYKQGHHGEHLGKAIHRVPTFIAYENGEEIGRIVEHCKTDLITDLTQLCTNLPTKPHYTIATELLQNIEDESFESDTAVLFRKLKMIEDEIENVYELNTLNYVLASRNMHDARLTINLLNHKLFPEKVQPLLAMASNYYDLKDYKAYLKWMTKVIALEPDNVQYQQVLEEQLHTFNISKESSK